MMKYRLLFLLSLGFCSTFFSQYMNGIVVYKDGSKKKGYLQRPQEISKNSIVFKSSLDKSAKKEDINLEDVKKLSYLEDSGKYIDFISVPYKKKNIWVYNYYTGKVKIYAQLFESDMKTTMVGAGASRMMITDPAGSSTYYYFQWSDEPVTFVAVNHVTHNISTIDLTKKGNGKRIVKFFKDKCPKMEEAFENKELKFKDSPMPFVEYFEKKCK
ncbi:hypothetical protein JSO54_04515 [Riemerella anatipestifer]